MLPKVDVRSRGKWRAWLRKHHASSEGVWLVYHKQHTGVKSVDYDDSVREALCFGWVDSLIKSLDGDTYARNFTPRRPGSKWSDSNRVRWKELAEAGIAERSRAGGFADHARWIGPRRSQPPAGVYHRRFQTQRGGMAVLSSAYEKPPA